MVHMEHRDPTAAEVAAVIRGAIARTGITQRELADRALVPLTTLNRRLNGDEFTYPELRSIAQALGTTATDLLCEASCTARAPLAS